MNATDTHPVRIVIGTALDMMRQWEFQAAESTYHIERASEALTQLVSTRDARILVACLKDVRRCSRNVLLHRRGAQGSQAMYNLELAVIRITRSAEQAAA